MTRDRRNMRVDIHEAERMMRLALQQARRARGKTWPNPMVGSVVARGGKVISVGYHRRAGLAHAEVEALSRAGRRARGSDLYVTLEPCHCFGRTGPCSSAIIDAGVRRVFVGTQDPNPQECGDGLAVLRRAGVEVVTGILEQECRELNEDYNVFIREKRPFVLLKAAVSLDGRLASSSGDARWITGEAARRRAHRLRAAAGAVLVGAGTVRQDDPALNVRLVRGRNPAVVVLDDQLSLSPNARLLGVRRRAPLLVYCSKVAPARKSEALRRRGAEVVPVPARRGLLDLKAVLRDLYRRGICRLLVEGGATVIGSFLSMHLVDRLEVHIAPCLLGSDGVPFGRWAGPRSMAMVPRLAGVRWVCCGADVVCTGKPIWPGRRR